MTLYHLVQRDARRALHAAGLPLAFFLIAATLFPFAVGPSTQLLARSGAGMLWFAATLTALLSIERLVRPDFESGILDQLAARGYSDQGVAAAKIVAHWLGFGPLLMIAALPGAGLLDLDAVTVARFEESLAIGTPALAAVSVVGAAVTAHLRVGNANAIADLLVLPLVVPVLIFGASASQHGDVAALKLLAGTSLMLCFGAPLAVGAALRTLRD